MSATPTLPPVLAGPLLRRTEASRLLLWLVTRSAETPVPRLWQGATELGVQGETQCLRLGEQAYLQLIEVRPDTELPTDTFLRYDLQLSAGGIRDWAPHLLYPGRQQADFVLRGRLDQVLHGSCRKPHHRAADGSRTDSHPPVRIGRPGSAHPDRSARTSN